MHDRLEFVPIMINLDIVFTTVDIDVCFVDRELVVAVIDLGQGFVIGKVWCSLSGSQMGSAALIIHQFDIFVGVKLNRLWLNGDVGLPEVVRSVTRRLWSWRMNVLLELVAGTCEQGLWLLSNRVPAVTSPGPLTTISIITLIISDMSVLAEFCLLTIHSLTSSIVSVAFDDGGAVSLHKLGGTTFIPGVAGTTQGRAAVFVLSKN